MRRRNAKAPGLLPGPIWYSIIPRLFAVVSLKRRRTSLWRADNSTPTDGLVDVCAKAEVSIPSLHRRLGQCRVRMDCHAQIRGCCTLLNRKRPFRNEVARVHTYYTDA